MNWLKKFWEFLKKDTLASWIVSLVLLFILIKFIIFPILSLITGSSLPLVVVESCSMYHNSDFEDWWYQNSAWYLSRNITKSDFTSFNLKSGLNKGDIVVVLGDKQPKIGEIIVYSARTQYPLIHRIVTLSPLGTKGDNNVEQLNIEQDIKGPIIGKAVARIPLIGWIKLIFLEPFKSAGQRGFC
jgi:signal peptidase I